MSPTLINRLRAAILLAATLAPAQTPPPIAPSTPAPAIKAGAEEVLLDVIARDKKGRPVKDLTAADFDVTDNGVKQKLLSVRLVSGAEAISKSGEGGGKLDPLRQIRLVSLVFDKLGLEARRVSRTAALDILKQDLGQNVYYSVWVIDQRLSAVQPFTNDRELLRTAIERATSGAYTEYAAQSAAIKKNLENQLGAPANANGQSLNQQVSSIGSQGYDPSQRLMAQIMYRILNFDEQAVSTQAGRSSIFALLGLAREQNQLPGRKTVVYLNEGLVVPISMDEAFRSMLSTANRSNVSFYPIDARGLLVGAQNRDAVNQLSDALANSARTSQRDGGAVDVSEVKSQDNAQASMRSNAQNALATMAESTGGKFVGNTNDFRGPLRQLAEDINTYYEITYNPAIQNYDGQYRKISVKVDRSDARLQTRDGYFALPTLESGSPVLFAWEVPLLKSLGSAPLPRNFDYHAGAMHFQPLPDGVRCAVVVEVPIRNLTFTDNQETKMYSAHLSLLALIKNQQGAIIQKFTRDLPLHGAVDKEEAVKGGNFIYEDFFTVPPGRYTLETALLDHNGEKVSAKRVSFLARATPSGVNLSSLAFVRSFDKRPLTEAEEALRYEGGKITPTLTAAVPAKPGVALSVYLVVYPDKNIAAAPELTLQFMSDGQLVGQAQPPLPAPDAAGRIAYVASSPTASMKPGIYQLRARVKQGDSIAQEDSTFTIEP